MTRVYCQNGKCKFNRTRRTLQRPARGTCSKGRILHINRHGKCQDQTWNGREAKQEA